jgi:putative SOS response-associated peptidase YedK
MPVILRGADAEAWIDPGIDDPKALVTLLRPFQAEEMIAFPVSSRGQSRRERRGVD